VTFELVPDGGSRFWSDSVATLALLPSTGVPGECRLVRNTRLIYEWNGTSWQIAGGTTGDALAAIVAGLSDAGIIYRGASSLDNDVPQFCWDVASGNLALGDSSAAAKVAVLGGDMFVNGKLGFYGQPPAAQYTATGTSLGFSVNFGTFAYETSTWTGDISGNAYTVGDIVAALKLVGILAM